MNILIIQNSESATGGLFQKFLAAECGAKIKVAKSDALGLAGNLADEADLVALLGSPHSVNQLGLPWIQQEAALVRRLVAAGRPLFGICFGAQLIARAMGGTVGAMERRIMGWFENDHAIDATWRGPWFRWHQEHIDPPAAASVLARSRSTIQAFQIGRALGVQFHPEVDQDIVIRWVQAHREELRRQHIDAAHLLEASRSWSRSAERRAYPLFEQILRRCYSPGTFGRPA